MMTMAVFSGKLAVFSGKRNSGGIFGETLQNGGSVGKRYSTSFDFRHPPTHILTLFAFPSPSSIPPPASITFMADLPASLFKFH
jgi:hypothetical protein